MKYYKQIVFALKPTYCKISGDGSGTQAFSHCSQGVVDDRINEAGESKEIDTQL